MSPSKVLITGISGQDGIYLSSHLLKNYEDIEIYGVIRSKEDVFFNNLRRVNDKFEPKNIDPTPIAKVKKIKIKPIKNEENQTCCVPKDLGSLFEKTSIEKAGDITIPEIEKAKVKIMELVQIPP